MFFLHLLAFVFTGHLLRPVVLVCEDKRSFLSSKYFHKLRINFEVKEQSFIKRANDA